jgi:hypothetical protein
MFGLLLEPLVLFISLVIRNNLFPYGGPTRLLTCIFRSPFSPSSLLCSGRLPCHLRCPVLWIRLRIVSYLYLSARVLRQSHSWRRNSSYDCKDHLYLQRTAKKTGQKAKGLFRAQRD